MGTKLHADDKGPVGVRLCIRFEQCSDIQSDFFEEIPAPSGQSPAACGINRGSVYATLARVVVEHFGQISRFCAGWWEIRNVLRAVTGCALDPVAHANDAFLNDFGAQAATV